MSKAHMNRVAEWGQNNGCVVCGAPYSHVHHLLEGRTPGRRSDDMLTIPLCCECHTGTGGIHHTRTRWSLRKTSEMQALATVLKALYGR